MKTWGTALKYTKEEQLTEDDELPANSYFVCESSGIVEAGEIAFKGVEQCEIDLIAQGETKFGETEGVDLIYAQANITMEIIGTQEVYTAHVKYLIKTHNPIPLLAWFIIAIAVSIGVIAIAVSLSFTLHRVGIIAAEALGGIGGIIIIIFALLMLLVLLGGKIGVTKKGVSLKK